MKKGFALLIPLLIVALVIVGGAFGLLFFLPVDVDIQPGSISSFEECVFAGYPVMESLPRKCAVGDRVFVEELENDPREALEAELENYFVERIWEVATDNLDAIPIEGFTPGLYLGAFPALEEYDFDGTQAYGGVWEYEDGELVFMRDYSEPITSAEGTLTQEGVKQLYRNLKIRMDFQIVTKADVDSFLEFLSQKEEGRVYCEASQRNADACLTIYQPVCGWFDSDKVQCVTYPCAQTFDNSCKSCSNPNILYYTDGACPSG